VNLFTDIDGVLLGKAIVTGEPVLAEHATDYLEFCLDNFDCYWLTTHCRGSIDTAVDYLAPYADARFMALAERIKPTQNAYVERFNRTVRHEWLDLHSFNSIEHAQLLATQWLWTYNNERPHTAIGGIPPRKLLEAA
jgi:hypothetical protein